MMRQGLVSAVLAGFMATVLMAPAAAGQPSIRERATEEISPGVYIRGGSVVIDLDGQCNPKCEAGLRCQETCRDGECDARSTDSNPCRRCVWECVE
jgi:hypothetical protein